MTNVTEIRASGYHNFSCTILVLTPNKYFFKKYRDIEEILGGSFTGAKILCCE
jgi:hypothetical protein